MKRSILALFFAAPALAYDSIEFLEPIKTSEMERPAAAIASVSRIYALDEKKGSLFIYDLSGKLQGSVGKFDKAKGLALSPDGRIFVADTGSSLIQVLDGEGKLKSSFGNRGSDPGKLKNPESIAVGSDGRVYVADTGNDRVEVFTSDGILLTTFGGSGKEPGKFRRPTRIAVDPSDFVYVLDSGNDRIQKFDPSARFVKEMRARGGDFAVDSYGFFYVMDEDAGKIIEEDASGNILGPFGSKGAGRGQYKRLAGISVAADGTLLVLDSGNGRIDRVVITNKLKEAELPPNLQTKISASGPSRAWPYTATQLAAYGDDLYAFLHKEGQLVLLDQDGKETAKFAAAKDVQGIAASKKLGLYFADTGAHRIQKFSLDGKWQANLAESTGVFDSKKKEGRVKAPRGVAINDQGTVYVADTGNRRIDAFNPDGMFLFGIGPSVGQNGQHELQEPVAVAWDKARFVYFLDKAAKKIFKCEPSGSLIAAWGEEGDGPGQFKEPVALAFDGNNYLYVLDASLRRVSVFTKDGKWMTDLFSGGFGKNELSKPESLVVQGSRLLVSDSGKNQITTFDLHPSLAAPAWAGEPSSKDGVVSLAWRAVSDSWTSRYRVFRAPAPHGPFTEIGATPSTRYEDSTVLAYEKYYYRVATEARTKDVGPMGPVAEITVSGQFNRAPVEISTVNIGNIFSANYKWYLKNPVGHVVVSNNVNVPFENVKLTFRLKDFMDFGYDTEVKRLDARKWVEIPLIATLNNRILEISEDTPIQAEFTLTYFEQGKQQTVSLTKPLRIYSRNAITWEDPERIANFVTPKDPPVLEFAREVLRQSPKPGKAEVLNHNVLTAMHLWDALSEAGVKFFTNPNNPYETVSEDQTYPVDYTQFPRETLKRKTGQCDDLTTLFISMLDSTKVRAAILDFPGHMALMFDTEADDPVDAGVPAEYLVAHEGTYWVPVEATMVGRPFQEAVRKAAYSYKAEDARGKVAVIDVRRAWERFEPATMPASDWNAEVPPVEARAKRFEDEADTMIAERYKYLQERFAAELRVKPDDVDARLELGMVEFQAGKKEAALAQFNQILAKDPKNAAALNNVGNVSFHDGDYAAAEKKYLEASAADPEDPSIWLNLVRAAIKLKDKEKALEYGGKAKALQAKLAPAVEALTQGL
jgi:DNA-binding beta-propeller fold protein YncE